MTEGEVHAKQGMVEKTWKWQPVRNSAGSHVRQGGESSRRKTRKIEVIIQALQPLAVSEKNQPRQCDVRGPQWPLHTVKFRLGNPEIDRFVMQTLEDHSRYD
jgi:hypothetical protein